MGCIPAAAGVRVHGVAAAVRRRVAGPARAASPRPDAADRGSKDPRGECGQRRYVEAIRRAGGHLVQLLDDAIDVASIEAGRLAIAPGAFDPRALARELAAGSEALAGRKGLRFRCDVDPSTPQVFSGDPVRVKQVLLNLVSNALKFTRAGGVVLRLSGLGGGGLLVRVSDTGPGLDAAQRARLFTRFVQVGPDGNRDRRGRGLGLAISRELVEAMGGTIRVESTPGRGACFIVELPPSKAGPDPRAAVRDPAGLDFSPLPSAPAPAAPGTAP
jgi:signal transduction histidine kinase